MKKKEQSHSTIGPIVGSLIVIIVLVIAALYVWGQHLSAEAKRQAIIDQENATNGQITVIPIHGTSTDPSEIQKDLNANPYINDSKY